MAAVLKRAYLAVYNWAVFFGWAQVLYYAVSTLLTTGHEGVYAAVERPLQLAQTAAEIIHGLVGLMRSPAGVGHTAADRVQALHHLGHPLELPRGELPSPHHRRPPLTYRVTVPWCVQKYDMDSRLTKFRLALVALVGIFNLRQI